MEFFIKQNSNLPILKMDVVRDGRTDSWKDFYSILDNAKIRFSMKSENDGIQKIFMKPAHITEKERRNPETEEEEGKKIKEKLLPELLRDEVGELLTDDRDALGIAGSLVERPGVRSVDDSQPDPYARPRSRSEKSSSEMASSISRR